MKTQSVVVYLDVEEKILSIMILRVKCFARYSVSAPSLRLSRLSVFSTSDAYRQLFVAPADFKRIH